MVIAQMVEIKGGIDGTCAGLFRHYVTYISDLRGDYQES
jgi:hypothetical protein